MGSKSVIHLWRTYLFCDKSKVIPGQLLTPQQKIGLELVTRLHRRT
jgi:hypothetical protein